MDPWSYLSGTDVSELLNNYGYLFSGIYILLKTVGLLGCGITLIIAIVRCVTSSASNPQQRVTYKDVITKKVFVIIGIFFSAYIAGELYGILLQF